MDKIYNYIGLIVFWIICVVAVWFVLGMIWQSWLKVRYRTWVFQIYEYHKAKKIFAIDKQNNYKFSNEYYWSVLQLHKARLEGKIKNYKWRSRHILKRKLIKIIDEALDSDVYKRRYKINK